MPPDIEAIADALAFSYLRFSTLEQALGDSLRRQISLRDDWLRRHPHVKLDTSLTLRDLGKSAFTGEHRKNPDRHALAAFLKLVQDGKVPRGSYLIVENLDRLTREDERSALRLWMDILDAGINIVQLQPETEFRHEKSDMLDIIRAIIELSRGHGESARKAERNGAAWQEKVARARQGEAQPPRRLDGRVTHAITDIVPAWIELRDGKPELIPERAAVVKRIFGMAASGYGLASIVKRLTQEKVPAFGGREVDLEENGEPKTVVVRGKERPKYKAAGGRYGAGVWVRAYLAKLLKDRRALGEHQPCGKGRKPDGDPIAGYFPAVVTEDEFNAARAGAAERRIKRGRVSEHVNVFAGLLRNARDGDTFFVSRDAASKGGHRRLVNTAGSESRVRYESFQADVFEVAILECLTEIDPHEILNGDSGPDESLTLANRLSAIEATIALLGSDLDEHGDSPALYARLRKKEEEKREVAAALTAAQQKAAHPLSAAWGECQSLAKTLATAPDQTDARLRLRSTLRRMIDTIHLLIVPRGQQRFCAAQIWFAGGKKSRSYLIHHRPPKSNGKTRVEGGWSVKSFATEGKKGDLDLRDPKQAAQLAEALERVEIA